MVRLDEMELFAGHRLGGKLVPVGGFDGRPQPVVFLTALENLALERPDLGSRAAKLQLAPVREEKNPHQHRRDGQRHEEGGDGARASGDVLGILHCGNAPRPA